MHDLPLVFFTVLVQTAIGMHCCLGALRLAAGGPGFQAGPFNEINLFVWPIFALGFIASAAHVKVPFNGPNIVRGLRHLSPLSVEIAVCSAFGAVGMAYSVLSYSGQLSGLHMPLLVISLILAVLAILAVSNVYLLGAVPAWNSVWTPIQFMLTTLVLGTIGVLWLTGWSGYVLAGERWLSSLSIVATCLLLTSIPAYRAWLAPLAPDFSLLPDYHSSLRLFRVITATAGLLFLIVAAVGEMSGRTILYASAFFLLAASELAGRQFFYDIRGTVKM